MSTVQIQYQSCCKIKKKNLELQIHVLLLLLLLLFDSGEEKSDICPKRDKCSKRKDRSRELTNIHFFLKKVVLSTLVYSTVRIDRMKMASLLPDVLPWSNGTVHGIVQLSRTTDHSLDCSSTRQFRQA